MMAEHGRVVLVGGYGHVRDVLASRLLDSHPAGL
jgi:hypothetical protein